MKNNKLLIVLVSLATLSIVSYIGDYIYYKVPNFDTTTVTDVESENILKIYLYNSKTKEFDIKEIKNRSISIDEGDYINSIIDNMKLEPSNYQFLAAYNKLDKSKLNTFVNSVKKTINENFEGIQDIIIEVDSN